MMADRSTLFATHATFESKRFRAWAHASSVPEDVAVWLEEPEKLQAGRDRSSSGRAIFVKRHARSSWKRIADRIGGRPSPSRRAFFTGLVLESAGVSAVRPLAAIESRTGGLSFTILEHLDGPDLGRYLVAGLEGSEPSERRALKSRTWRELAGLVAKLHAAGVRQRDLKAPNILVPLESSSSRAVLVDLEGMRFVGRLPSARARMRDLARLATSLRAPDVRDAGVERGDIEELVSLYLEA